MTTLYGFLTFLLAVFPMVTADPGRCCTFPQLSGQVVFAGKTQFQVYVDYSKKVALEVHGGNAGIDYVLEDGNTMTRYQRMTSGDCKKYPVTGPHRYFQCVPENAVLKKVDAEFGVNLEGWIYNPDSDTSRLVVIETENCLPYRVHQLHGGKLRVAHFINLVNKVDSSVFNKDVSDCIDA